ncbi:MAG: hypothetical protein ACOVNQ_10870 [Pirellula sp.]
MPSYLQKEFTGKTGLRDPWCWKYRPITLKPCVLRMETETSESSD